MPSVLARFEAARAEGLDVAANQYPWTAAANPLDSCLPPWMREGGKEKLLARLKDADLRARAKIDMGNDADDWQNQYFGSGGPSRIIVSTVLTPSLKAFEGKTVEEIAAAQKKDPRDALMDVVLADGARSSCIFFCMDEADVKAALRHRIVSFCTDSGASATDGILSEEKSHPRGWASTARILATYVRDEKVLPLEEAVRTMTSFAAARAGLGNRGLIREGFAADLVAFDLPKVKAVSTYADPLHYSEGFPYVAVNGALVVDEGRITAARPGKALLGPGAAR
jgi:dihydroorotase/N-acyl-D-amino-acid deacylase